MPYVKAAQRAVLADYGLPVNGGELNFVISAICDEIIKEKGLCYATINEIVGALECCKLEIYRRIAAPYEDIKIKENGDVFSKENLV